MDSQPLQHRIIIAAIDALREDDPTILIGVADNEVRIAWPLSDP